MKFFVGNTSATKILLGSTLVWPLSLGKNNKITYTSTDGNIVTPKHTDVFGANIISNEYNNGMGVIIFDNDITMIGESAFYDCNTLKSVNIPDSVTTIGDRAFFYCERLTSVNIPESVTTIGFQAFDRCIRLTSVTIPDSVTMMGEQAFRDCWSLTSLTIGNNVPRIGTMAFYWCSALTSLTIGNSVTEIGDSAFYYCEKLTSVTIPKSVTMIGASAFGNSKHLISVDCKPTTPPILGDNMVFNGNNIQLRIFVPVNSVNAYKKAEYWSDYDIMGRNF